MGVSFLSLRPQYGKTREKKINNHKLQRAVEEKPDAYPHELAKPFNVQNKLCFMHKKIGSNIRKNSFKCSEKPEESQTEYLTKIVDILPEDHVCIDE